MSELHLAKLVLKELDGIPLVRDTVPLGTRYIVDVTRRTKLHMYNLNVKRSHNFEYVWAMLEDRKSIDGFMPVDLFEIDEGIYDDTVYRT